MEDASAKVLDLIFGRWRSQILYAGVKLGVFDALSSGPRNAVDVARTLWESRCRNGSATRSHNGKQRTWRTR